MPQHSLFPGIFSPMLGGRLRLSPLPSTANENAPLQVTTPSDSTCLDSTPDDVFGLEGGMKTQAQAESQDKRHKKVSFHAITLVIDSRQHDDNSSLLDADEDVDISEARPDPPDKLVEGISGIVSPTKAGLIPSSRTLTVCRVLKFLVANDPSGHTFECPALLQSAISTLFPPLIRISRIPSGILPAHAASPTCIPSSNGHTTYLSGIYSYMDIQEGQCIFAERPCLLTPYSILDGERKRDLAELFNRLDSERVDDVLSLLSPESNPTEGAEWYEQIIRRYSLAIRLSLHGMKENEKASKHRALFLKSSRIRHSCTPNARWGWDMKSFSLRISAIKPIPEGKEITVAKVLADSPQIQGSPTGFKCVSKACVDHCVDSVLNPFMQNEERDHVLALSSSPSSGQTTSIYDDAE